MYGSNDDFMAAFGALINTLGGGGDKGQAFPESDAADFARGASSIPASVTDARRAGQTVKFVTSGPKASWYWQMPDGSRVQ
jgi:hypothetical protein